MSLRLTFAAMACCALPSVGFAAVQQVGLCKGPKILHFNSITEALASQPASGSTIYLCPKVYAEQLTIVNPTNLVGVTDPTSAAAILTPPVNGLIQNAQSSDPNAPPYAAQIAVLAGAGTVNISNITIDGTNNKISSCSPVLVGILFQNTSGTLLNNRLINQSLVNGPNGLGGCQSGNAIELLGSGGETVSVLTNDVSGFQKNGITVDSVAATISGNTVTGQGATPAIAQNGIEVDYSTATVSQNIVADVVYTGPDYGATGILVIDSPGAKITGNTGTNTQGLVYDYSDAQSSPDNPIISSNKIQATHTFDGIDVCGVAGATISGNIINGSDESAIHIDSECNSPSSATLTSNKINGACVGILVGQNSALGSASTKNTFFNTITQTLPNSDTCPGTAPQVAAHHGGRRVSRAAPVR